MATNTKLVELANGRILRLTIGEINAIKAFVKMNGKNGSGPKHIQYSPGSIKYSTVDNLISKGVMEWVVQGVPRFVEGVLEISVKD